MDVEMSEIAFCMLPEPGHIIPSLRVAQRLQMMGFRVSYLCPPALSDYFREIGFAGHPIFENVLRGDTKGSLLHDSPSAGAWYRALARHLSVRGVDFGAMLASEVRNLPFDLLVCDGSIVHEWGTGLAAALQKPMAALSVVLPDPETDRPVLVPQIVLCPQEFDLPATTCRLRSNQAPTTYAEPSVCREGDLRNNRHVANWPAVPIIYCSFGTQTYRYANLRAIFRSIIDACIGLPYHLLISCKDSTVLDGSLTYPPNVTILPTVPQMAILEQASLFISHGGLGGVKESIMANVPLLIIPFDADQPRNARRVLYHGLGTVCGPSDCTAERVRKLINQVIGDPHIIRRLRQMGEIFYSREQEAPAAAIIARYVTNP